MLSSPNSTPSRPRILKNRTNAPRPPTPRQSRLCFSDKKKGKRIASELEAGEGQKKRVKLATDDEASEDSDSDYETGTDTEDNVPLRLPQLSGRRHHERHLMRPLGLLKPGEVSTRPILQSFVSSNKSDVYKCQSNIVGSNLTPPYACSFTNGARTGGIPLLAVATEQGSLHIINTTPRKDWDVEPPRLTSEPHANGIFDVKWNAADTMVATCSADQTTRITSVARNETVHVLRGHCSTVKCIAWDPNHPDLLATGGRDGAIHFWDLRVGNERSQGDEGDITLDSTRSLTGAHDSPLVSRARTRKRAPRSVTSLFYADWQPYGLISTGSFDGILRYWDMRMPSTPRKSKAAQRKPPPLLFSSSVDPTTLGNSRRPRGIISIAKGTGPTEGFVFGLSVDSRIHTYALPSLEPLSISHMHDHMQATAFSIGLSISPCGRWLACGGNGNKGSAFLFDVSNSVRPGSTPRPGVELNGQLGEVGAVDWAQESLATCADDGTVRIWRPDINRYRACWNQPEESRWDWSWSLES